MTDDPHETRWQRRLAAMRDERLSARTLDAQGALDAARLRDIRAQFEQHGAVHVQRTGLRDVADLAAVTDALGFSAAERFDLGGRTSASWQPKWVAPGIRRMDYYPPAHYLIPNNEVQYRRSGPARVMFFCQRAPSVGGRTFVHSAAAVEQGLRAAGDLGLSLLDRIARHGLTLVTGFLDRRHPAKPENYQQSWQERFDTDDPDEAIARARSQRDEYDHCEWYVDAHSAHPTLLTRITLSGFKRDPRDGRAYLRFPRIAMDAPAARNGYRRFPLGNGDELTDDERALLRDVYLDTREGTAYADGDLVLFDNVRYGHSREAYEGPREVYVAMAGTVWDDATDAARAPRPAPAVIAPPRCARSDGASRYTVPPDAVSWRNTFSARTLDLGGEWSDDGARAAREALARYGAVHVRHTGLRAEHDGALPDAVLASLGFGDDARFAWGGMHSGRTTRRALSRALRATDAYPPHLWLLPHNEVLYQRDVPARLLFFSASPGDPARGGRTFVHCALAMERYLRACGAPGEALLASLRAHGHTIEMGFVDEAHPDRARNYFRSWQDRFETSDRDEALARCLASTRQFDAAWWREEPLPDGGVAHTLMTRITVPAFARDPVDGVERMLFPRIALAPPAHENGHRRYPKGDGAPFTDDEVDLLLGAFLATREGVHYGAGDILLCDNVRYGHSRESYEPPRSLGVAMAGEWPLPVPPHRSWGGCPPPPRPSPKDGGGFEKAYKNESKTVTEDASQPELTTFLNPPPSLGEGLGGGGHPPHDRWGGTGRGAP